MENNSANTWKKLSCPDSVERFYHTSTLYKHYIITYGGLHHKTSIKYDDFKILNLKTGSFENFNLVGDIPSKRFSHSACLFNSNKILIFGGRNDDFLHDTVILTIEETSPLTLTYKKITTTGGENLVRSGHSADVYNNKMYVFGGRYHYKPLRDTNELWSLDLETFHWELCETTGDIPEERNAHCSAVYNDRLYIFGGHSESKRYTITISQCSFLSFENMKWQPLDDKGLGLFPREGASSAIIGDIIYLIGGPRAGDRSREIQSYNFKENIFKDEGCQGDYRAVQFGSCVAWENKLFLWGGLVGNQISISQITSLELSNSSITNKGSSNFIALVKQFLNEAPYHDITFEVESELIPAHKWWLIKKSKYFANMFSSGMMESKSSKIVISDIKPVTFKAFLEFLYTDSIDLRESLALELFQQADKYSVPALKTLCEQYLSTHISPRNYVNIASLAEVLDAGALREATVAYIAKNIKILKNREDFVKISDDLLRDVIIKITVR